MFSPVGSQPPSVYWRRRIIVIGAVVLLIVLIVLTAHAAFSNDSTPIADNSNSASTTPTPTPPSSTRPTSSAAAPSPSKTSSKSSKSSKASSTKPPTPSSAALARCRPAGLAVQAVVAKPTYKVGDEPTVELQVTNTGTRPCTQDLADAQIELKVYNGESRVWGSHDCEIMPGTDVKTLAVNSPVRVSIVWTGSTSRPKCAGTRQRVGAGTYTLYAVLSGQTGKAAQFSIG